MDLEGLYRDVVETSPDGIWVFDLAGRTVYANPALAELLGVSPQAVRDMTVLDSLDALGRVQFEKHLGELRAGRLEEQEVEVCLLRADGERVWTLVRESPVFEEGRLTAVLHRFRDYHRRHQALNDLRASRAQLSEAHRITRIGGWTWDLSTDEIMGTPELYALYGLDPAIFPATYVRFLSIVHPADRAAVDAAVQRAHDGEEEFDFEARIEGVGGWVWTRGRGVPHRDHRGVVLSMSGTHQDVTESKQAELALLDLVAQNTLLQAVAVAANEARTLREVLVEAQHLVLLHDDWERGRAFVPACADSADGPGAGGVVPLQMPALDGAADLADLAECAIELEVAGLAYRARRPVWDARRLTLAFPIAFAGEVCAVLTITSAAPLERHAMIEAMAEVVAVQLGRVAERERAERALAGARDAAMEASRQKSEFLATMSHEIRTPLNGVIGLNDLLLRTCLDPDQQRLSSGVQVASRALLGLINDVLDFSKIEAGRLELETVDFEVRPIVDQVAGVLGEAARAGGLELVVTCDPDVPRRLAGDPVRLSQVLTNLVSNAVKFTERGEVTVHASVVDRDDERVGLRVAVSDTGIGIDTSGPGGIDALFAPFTQADASTTRVYGGTGLGLAIAREIVTAMDGDLSYAPRRGGGSVFTFTVVLDRAESPTSAVAVRPGRVVPAARVTPAGLARSVLVVEDNAVNQLVAAGLLRSMGYEVEVAEDGLHALQLLDRRTFDVVLMDVQMPRMDGYAATRVIRGRERGRPTPIVAMTAAAVDGERERCLDAGMDAFLTKPIDPAALGSVLNDLLDEDRVVPPRPEAAAPPPGTESLDVERLDMLRDLDESSTDYLDRAIGNFRANSVAAVDSIRAAILAGDAAGVRHVVHKLVGSALNLGMPAAAADGRRIEHLADDGTVEGALDLLPALEDSLQAGRDALSAYQSSYSGVCG